MCECGDQKSTPSSFLSGFMPGCFQIRSLTGTEFADLATLAGNRVLGILRIDFRAVISST